MAKNKDSVFLVAPFILVALSQTRALAAPPNAPSNFADPAFRHT